MKNKHFYTALIVFMAVFGFIFFVAVGAKAATILFPSGGGTGWGFPGGLKAHTVLVGNDLNRIATVTPSTSGFVLTSNGVGSDPTFQASSGGGVGDSFTHPALGQSATTSLLLAYGQASTSQFTASSTVYLTGLSAGFLYLGSGSIVNSGASSTLFGFTPLNPTRQITIAGTANQLTSSAGAQDLSADRTWTLSLPNNVIFPIAFNSIYGTTTYASSTAQSTGNFAATNATTTTLTITGAGPTNCNGTSALTTSSTGVVGCTAQPQGTVTSVSGTTNQITSSGGATPVIALANNVIFPISFNATYGTTTFASSTALTATRLFATDATTTSLAITNETLSSLLYSGVGGSVLSVATGTVSAGSSAITVTAGRSAIGGALAIDCAVATGSQAGCLSSGDWTTFNAKPNGLNSKWATTTSPIDALAVSPNGGVNTLVGIGTTTPHFSLQIASSTGPQLALSDTSSTADRWIFRSVGNNFYLASSSALTFATSTLSTANNPFTILGGTTLRTSGNVGLGTSSPYARLSIQADAGATYLAIGSSTSEVFNISATANTYPTYGLGTTSPWGQFSLNPNGIGTGPAFVIGSSSKTWFQVNNGGLVGIGTTTPAGKLALYANNGESNLNLFIIGSTTATATTTHFRILNDGTIFAPNTTSASAAQTGYWCYDTNGQLIRDSAVCLVSALKYKKDINDLSYDSGIAELMKVRFVSYYKKDPLDKNDSGEQVGVIADDMFTIDPRLVTKDSNGEIHGFRYDQFTAIIGKSVQQLYAQFTETTTNLISWNRDQDKSLKRLEDENAQLKVRLDKLEAKSK